MAAIHTLAGVLALAMAAAPPQTPAPAPASAPEQAVTAGANEEALPPDLATIEAMRDLYERLTVPVSIGGLGPFRFLIDTGAQATVITGTLAERLSLTPTGQARLVAMGSSAIVDTVDLDGLEFADRRINGLTAPLLKGSDIGADGILGLDSLQQMRVLIDFSEGRITVADADQPGSNNGYEIVVRARRKFGQMVITDARIEGIRTAVIIDTGAQASVGNLELERKLRAKHHDTLVTTDVNGFELESGLAFADDLEIGGLTLDHVPIAFTSSPVFAALDLADRPAIILGMRNLSVLDRVAIDFPSSRILFDLPSGVAREDLIRRLIFTSRTGTI